MPESQSEILVSIETECLTAVPNNPEGVAGAMNLFLSHLSRLAPTLSGHGGIFNPYGKVYCDCGHIEIAEIECDSPYVAPLIMERLEMLAAQAVARMADSGTEFVLANNNHSGLLTRGCPTWGDHDNYLVDQHPSSFTEQILPFLVTRIYGGAGGVCYPTGHFVAGIRSTCMEMASGGGTTDARAIHSLTRDEHHMGPSPTRFRYHLIAGDGHRSQFNWAIQLGATALAVKAATTDLQLCTELALLRSEFSPDWLTTLREVNILARGNRPLAIHPLVIRTQRLYLGGARRWVARLDDPPAWIPRLLGDWQRMLLALEQVDRVWLSRHLDTFAKYEFYSAMLAEAGLSFGELRKQPQLFHELALLDQSYHEFCSPSSVFAQLEQAGALDHRVGARIEPGQEPDPYVPEVHTRARARARFIRDHQGQPEFVVDWAYIHDRCAQRLLRMYDPFSQELGEWSDAPTDSTLPHVHHHLALLLHEVPQYCDRGRFDHAHFLLRRAETECRLVGLDIPTEFVRYQAWLSARRGYLDGVPLLQVIYDDQPLGLREITDYCGVHRFTGLRPDLGQMEPWIQRGLRLLDAEPVTDGDWDLAAAFRENAAVALTRHGRLEEARLLLAPALAPAERRETDVRRQALLLAALGELCRRGGQLREAHRALREAMRLQRAHGWEGPLSYGTLLSLAKCERWPSRALRWVTRAEEIQIRNSDHVAHTAALLIKARLCGDSGQTATCRTLVQHYRDRLPALAACPLLAQILSQWDAWTTGAMVEHAGDKFWGL